MGLEDGLLVMSSGKLPENISKFQVCCVKVSAYIIYLNVLQ